MKTTQEQAIERIQGKIINEGESVIYYDDSMHQHYLSDIEDIQDLQDLMDSDDEDVSRDAYSHWCANTSHPECDEHGRTESRQNNDGLLAKGDSYTPDTLVCRGWTQGDGSGHSSSRCIKTDSHC